MSVAERRQREKEARRDLILDAAQSVFLRKGMEAATVEEVAAAAEVAKGTVYLYFKSKEDLFQALCARELGGLVRSVEDAGRARGTGREKLKGVARAYVELARSRPDHFRLFLSWMMSAGTPDPDSQGFHEHRDAVGRIHQVIAAAIEAGKSDGSLRQDVDSRRMAQHLWAGLLGHLFLHLNRSRMEKMAPIPVDFDALPGLYIEFYLDAVAPRAGGTQ